MTTLKPLTLRICALAVLAALSLPALVLPQTPAVAQAREADADYSEFYEPLQRYGRWIEHPRWGYVWAPAANDGTWRPYSRGHWVLTEEHGWYWESEEPWGWATYHHGRWVLDEDGDWLWVPGREWGPAWVAWRSSDDYVGWAPLPPDAVWEDDREIFSFSASYYDSPRYAPIWCFVRPAYLTTPGLYRYLVPRSRSIFIVRQTRFLTNYRRIDRRVYNRGIDVRLVERATRRPVVPVRVALASSAREHGLSRTREGRPQISVYRPQLAALPGGAAPPRPRIVSPSAVRPDGGIGRIPGSTERWRRAPAGGDASEPRALPNRPPLALREPAVPRRLETPEPQTLPRRNLDVPREARRPQFEPRVEPRLDRPALRSERQIQTPQFQRQPSPPVVQRQPPPQVVQRQAPPPQVLRQAPPPPPVARPAQPSASQPQRRPGDLTQPPR